MQRRTKTVNEIAQRMTMFACIYFLILADLFSVFFFCVCLKGVREQLIPSAHISTCVSRDRFRRCQKFNGVGANCEAQNT